MKGNKIVATLVVLAMLFSTMMVLNKLDVNFVEKASATTMGVDDFQGSPSGANILNMTEPNLVYGTTSTLTFNGTLIEENCQIYYPTYNSEWDGGSSRYEVWTNWTKYSGVSLGSTATEPTASLDLDYAGLWIVAASNSPGFWKVNMSNMSIYESGAWENITGWFWVNSSSWTVSLSESNVYYDKNESLTITVKDAAGDPITDAAFVDIWNIAGGAYSLRYHKVLDSSMNGVWTLTGADMYDEIWHSGGAGIYTVSAYADVSPGHTEATLIYGESGDSSYNGERGYNSTFGNTTIWAGRFITSAPTTQIRAWDGDPVTTATWTETTYKWDTCGPFNPPEYWADYENFTVKAGVPTMVVINGSQFWKDTYDNIVNISLKDYDDNWLTIFDRDDVKLYNKSNKPTRSDSTPISSDYYNVSFSSDNRYVEVRPNGTGNTWGYNSTNGRTWAAKGKMYVVIAKTTLGNASEEWNGSATFDLITAAARFKWVNDDGSTTAGGDLWGFEADNDDGVIPYIPPVADVPLQIQFKVQSGDYTYWGDLADGEATSITECAENITISGDSLFTGTVDTFPSFDTGWFVDPTWTVPLIPTMNANGGEITIRVNAWNRTLTETLQIGGLNYWQNGSVVTVTPNEFNIDVENKTLAITVKDATGYEIRGATVELYYIDYRENGGNPIEAHTIDSITSDSSGVYTMLFNTSQQKDNQTTAFAGGYSPKAPQNLTIYVMSRSGSAWMYGYALIRMNPENDLEVELSQSTFMAGYEYETFWLNCTFVGNSTDTPNEDDKAEFFMKIYNENGSDVTDTLLSDGTYTSADLTGDADCAYDLDNVYILEPGVYTVYAYNNTHDSTGHNATFEVVQVEVACDMSPFIWMDPNDNISATFTVTYQGAPVNGSLVIDNLSDEGDYNRTYKNTSFDGSTDQGGNTSKVIDEDDLPNGVVTVNDITANYLPDGTAMENITFWFAPVDGEYARAIGRVPVTVPTVTPDHMYVAVGRLTTVKILVTGRGDPLADVFVALNGRGVEQNGTSGTDGKVTFGVLPTSTGDIEIDVGEDGRTVDTVITVTSWALDISTDPISQVDEGETFTVTVIKEGTTEPVVGASVKFNGITQTTDATGKTTYTAPTVTSDRTFTITATAIGYAPDPDALAITVVNVPKLILVVPDEVQATATFEVAVADDTGSAIVGAAITFDGKTYITGVNGIAKLTAPDDEGSYPIEAAFGNYVKATDIVTVTAAPGIPGFELLTLIAAIGVAFILFRRRRN